MFTFSRNVAEVQLFNSQLLTVVHRCACECVQTNKTDLARRNNETLFLTLLSQLALSLQGLPAIQQCNVSLVLTFSISRLLNKPIYKFIRNLSHFCLLNSICIYKTIVYIKLYLYI